MFDSLAVAKKALDATNDQTLMGYRLLITLRYTTNMNEPKPVELEKENVRIDSVVLNNDESFTPVDQTAVMCKRQETVNTATRSAEDILLHELTSVFLKDLKSRIAGPTIHDFYKTSKSKRSLESPAESEPEREKSLENIKLPNFKKKSRSTPENTLSASEVFLTPNSTDSQIVDKPLSFEYKPSEEETDTEEHEAFLKQQDMDTDSYDEDFVQQKRKRKPSNSLKKQVVKKQKRQQKPKKQEPIAPEPMIMDEEEKVNQDQEEEMDREEFERLLLVPDESDSEELMEPQSPVDEPMEWDPLLQVQDPEEYIFLRAALLQRAGKEIDGKFYTTLLLYVFYSYSL